MKPPSKSGLSAPVAAICLLPAFVCPRASAQQPVCPSGKSTTISGIVYAPNGSDPLPNVFVYVPGAPLNALPSGPDCETADEMISGAPLVSTVTAVNGSFILEGAPAGSKIPLVIQTGKWRRQVVIPSVAPCANTVVPASLSRFPRSRNEGDIPRIAVVTGSADGLECILRKIGIADTEFTDFAKPGRINLFKGSGAPGAIVDSDTPVENSLEGAPNTLDAYDMVMFACQGGQFSPASGYQTNLVDYANRGGRVFATHFGYVWLYDDAPFSGAASWDVDQLAQFTADPESAGVTQILSGGSAPWPVGVQLAEWLKDVHASSIQGAIPIGTLRKDQDGVTTPESQPWLTITDQHYTTPTVMQFSFDTPLGSTGANKCGRVMFAEYHTEDQTLSVPTVFPAECSSGPITPQEQLLEFSLFNLTGFLRSGQPPSVSAVMAGLPAKVRQGSTAIPVTVSVANTGSTPATTSLTAKVGLPKGLSAISMRGGKAGTGWKCVPAELICTRSSALNGGATDPIAIDIAVASTAPVASAASVTATLAGGGLLGAAVVTRSLTITGHPILTWPAPAAIMYGTALSNRQLDAATSISGKFTYSPALGTVLGTGQHTLSVAFTPTDRADFSTATAAVSLLVNPATLSVAAANASVAYGKPLPAFTYTVTGFVNKDSRSVVKGLPTETTTAKDGSKPGNYPITVAKGSLSATNYRFVFKNGTLTITPAN